MSLLEHLEVYKGSYKNKKRKGRGKGSGKGGTSCRGHKGQKARKSPGIPAGFEGGAMPLARRLPKFGFTNAPFKKVYDIINLSQLKNVKENIGISFFIKKGWTKQGRKVKVLGKGELSSALEIQAHKFSRSAQEKIKKAGGTVKVL